MESTAAGGGEEGRRRGTGTGTGEGEGGIEHRHPLLEEKEGEGRRRGGESVLLKVVVMSQVLVRERRGGVIARGSVRKMGTAHDQKEEREKEVGAEEEADNEKRGGASDQCRLGRSRRSRRHASKY
jgi:hypothetical protein